MKNASKQALVPVEQAIILFHGYEILVVRLSNGWLAAALQSLCAMLGILTHGQAQRIRRDKDLAEHLLLALVETPGGPQHMDVLIVEAIPSWVIGLNLKQIAPEKRQLILALKVEAIDFFHQHFFTTDARQAPPSEAESFQSPPSSPWQLGHQFLDALEQESLAARQEQATIRQEQQTILKGQTAIRAEQAALREEQAIIREHQEAIEEAVMRLKGQVAGSATRGGPQQPVGQPPSGPLLSKDHLYQAYALAGEERRRSGEAINDLLRELAQALGVPDISDLPDAAWDDVSAWFWQRAATADG